MAEDIRVAKDWGAVMFGSEDHMERYARSHDTRAGVQDVNSVEEREHAISERGNTGVANLGGKKVAKMDKCMDPGPTVGMFLKSIAKTAGYAT